MVAVVFGVEAVEEEDASDPARSNQVRKTGIAAYEHPASVCN